MKKSQNIFVTEYLSRIYYLSKDSKVELTVGTLFMFKLYTQKISRTYNYNFWMAYVINGAKNGQNQPDE